MLLSHFKLWSFCEVWHRQLTVNIPNNYCLKMMLSRILMENAAWFTAAVNNDGHVCYLFYWTYRAFTFLGIGKRVITIMSACRRLQVAQIIAL